MASAKKCDRCGKYYDRYDPPFLIKNNYDKDFRSYLGEFDLCDECMKLLKEFLIKEE